MKKLFIALMLCCGLCYARHELDIYMIIAQMEVESHGDWSVVSHKGCIGMMQILPSTARDYGIPIYYLDHPVIGMDAGIEIMSSLWSRFETSSCDNVRCNILRFDTWELALSAYNCGLSRTLKSLRLGRRWQYGVPLETRHYIRKVLNRYYGRIR